MGNVLLRRSAREMRRMAFRLVGIALIMGMAAGIYVGIHSAIRSLYDTRDLYYDRLDMADAELRFVPDDLANVPNFSGIPAVRDWSARLLAPGQLQLADQERYPTLIVAQTAAGAALNRIQVVAGRPADPTKPTEVLVDRNFAAYHHIRVGDHFRLTLGNDEYRLAVRGIALSPEFLVAPANPSVFFPIKGSMGVVYAPIELISNRLGFTLVNSLVFKLDAGIPTKKALLDRISHRAAQRLDVEEVIPRDRQLGHMFMSVHLSAFSIFVPAVIVIFFLVALVVGFFLMYRWVQAQRQTFGVLLALGFSQRRLLLAEMLPVGFIALAALIIAVPATAAMLKGFAATYSTAIGLPAPVLHVYPSIALRGAAALVLVVMAMAALPLISVLRLTPTRAIRGASPSTAHAHAWHGRLFHRVRHRPFIAFPLRNVVRSARIATMTTLAVGLAIGVSISYFMATDSFNGAIADSFTADEWNVAVDFLVPVWHDELAAFQRLPGLRRAEEVLRGPIRLAAHGITQPASITGYEAGRTMRRPAMEAGVFPVTEGETIVLEYKLANSLGVHVGDDVDVNNENRHHTVRVVGIFSGAVPGAAYAPIGAVRRWLDMPNQVNGLLLDTADTSAAALARLRRLPHVGAVTPKAQLVSKVTEISSEAVQIVYLAAAFSIAVCVVVLIVSGTFTVSERRELYTTLRTLGFQDQAVGRLIVIELCTVGILGAALAIPIGSAMASYLIGKLSQAWFEVRPLIGWRDVLLPTVPLLVLLPLSARPAIRTILRTPPADSIKERRYG